MNIQETMLQDMQESIKKNLPQAVGEELQKLLAQGKKNAEQVVDLRAILTRYEQDIRNANDVIVKHGDLNAKMEAVERDQAKLQDANNKLVAEKANLRAEIAEAKSDTFKHVFDTVFRVPTVRENIQRDVAIPVNNNGYTHIEHKQENETKIVERD